jgi:acetylornithine/N-succinyldiaminopimelate aminotransferase
MSTTRQLFLQHLAQTSDFPMGLEIVRGEGNYLIDVNGKKYLDLISGIAVSNLGHSNPAIVNAVVEQAKTNMHAMVYGEYVLGPQVNLATKLTSLLPSNLSSVYFVNSGSEAVEGALKLAKRFTGKSRIISFNNSYHGSTHGALSLGGNEEMRNAFRPLLPEIMRIDYNNFDALKSINESTAAVIIEPIQAEAGMILPVNNYLEKVRELCTKHKALLIFDEIQTGFGRTGKLFAFEKYNVIPDVLLLGKAFGGGMPLGAFISSNEIMGTLKNDPVLGHITTFGGHPVSCAASLAALTILTDTKIVETVYEKGKLLTSLLLANKKIIEVRGTGLMFALQLNDFDQVQTVIKQCLEKGIILDWFLYNNSSIRIAPPLTITNEEIEMVCKTLNLIII